MRFGWKQKFFENSLVLIFVAMIPQIASGQASQRCQNISYNWKSIGVQKKKTQNYWIDSKFSLAERKLIKNALGMAVERMQDKSVWQNVKDNYGFAHPKTKTLTDAGVCNNINARRNILFHQLNQLTRTKDIFGKQQFPKIQIHLRNIPPKKGKVGWVGYAYYNRVRIYWDYANRSWKQSGSFSIYLNRHYLQKSGIYKDENYWAGTIAHEMLHNLGHQHPNASNSKYQKYQINVLTKAIRGFGQEFEATAGDIQYPTHKCQSKSQGTATANDNE